MYEDLHIVHMQLGRNFKLVTVSGKDCKFQQTFCPESSTNEDAKQNRYIYSC